MIRGMSPAIHKWWSIVMLLLCFSILPSAVLAQTGNSSSISGTVLDPSGAVVADAAVTIHDPVSGYERSATTDSSGNFSFPERAIQSVSLYGYRERLLSVRPGCGRTFVSPAQPENQYGTGGHQLHSDRTGRSG